MDISCYLILFICLFSYCILFTSCIYYSYIFQISAELYALSRYVATSYGAQPKNVQAIDSSQSDQTDAGKNETRPDESELRLAQLQHQLPANEPGALMQMVEDATSKEDDDDDETKECKYLFKDMKFFLSREVGLI